MTDKRRKIEELVLKVLSAMDPSGINTSKYKTFFDSMDDPKFNKWIKEFFDDEKSFIRLDVEEFDPKRVLRFENVERAAKVLNIKLFEYVYTFCKVCQVFISKND